MVILRFRTKEGTFRLQGEADDDFLLVLEQLVKKINTNDNQSIFIADKPNTKGEAASTLCGRSIADLGLKNGDMLYISYESGEKTDTPKQTNGSTEVKELKDVKIGAPKLELSALDLALGKLDGLIKRDRSTMCRHGPKGMCEYCSPLPPWDKEYLRENFIKHQSFYSYLKQVTGSYPNPLEELNYNIDLSCKQGHLPYPRGICSKCQPSSITLQLQKFRMVDHVEFADSTILNNFIESWRLSGNQRYGLMYGKYEKFEKVPLGIKAVVEAIYEPPQHGELDGITLLEWENTIDEIAKKLGLVRVGYTFTDLTDSGQGNGRVIPKRHKDSYFLTNLEVLMSAKNQIDNPYFTGKSATGKFSSRYVTCVISGGVDGVIEPRSYQVSLSGEALVRADIINASTQPNKLFVNESSNKRYVPDIAYSEINEYGLEVKSNAKPAFPVDFLLVSLSDSFPLDPKPMFETGFVIENRDFLGELQDLHKVRDFINGGGKLNDFHFVVYLARTGILGEDEFGLLTKFALEKKESDYMKLMESPGWLTLLTILDQS